MAVIRGLRLLRVFRVFKLGQFLGEASLLQNALASSRHKITVFLGTITILVAILGTAMYLIEGKENGFTSIPTAIYWAIVTMTNGNLASGLGASVSGGQSREATDDLSWAAENRFEPN